MKINIIVSKTITIFLQKYGKDVKVSAKQCCRIDTLLLQMLQLLLFLDILGQVREEIPA